MNEREQTDFCFMLSALTEQKRRFLSQFAGNHLHAVSLDRMSACRISTLEAYQEFCIASPEEQELLFGACFNSTSEFFRDRWTFSLLERTFLPPMLARGVLRIWCAGCAAGQEALSLAILVEELSSISAGTSATIFATDLGPEQTLKALDGRYPRSQFRHMTIERMERWFFPDGDELQAHEELRAKLRYTTHDLLDDLAFCPPDSIFGNFNIISCMNVLLYYNHNAQVRILQNFRRTLAVDGLLVVAPSEVGIVNRSGLFANVCDGPIFQVIPGERCRK